MATRYEDIPVMQGCDYTVKMGTRAWKCMTETEYREWAVANPEPTLIAVLGIISGVVFAGVIMATVLFKITTR